MDRPKVLNVGLIALVALAVLGGIFWLFDFHAAQSETSVQSQVSTGSTGSGEDLFRQGRWRTVNLYVPGDDEVSRSLREGLRQRLAADPLFAEVALLEQPGDAGESLLVVEAKQVQTTWLGVYAQADVQAQLSYSTTGGVFAPGQAFAFTSDNPGIVVVGEYKLKDQTRGIVSRPAYFRLLGEKLAAEVARSLTEQIRARAA